MTYLTVAEIVTYVKKTYGKKYAMSGMTNLLHRLGFVHKKPAMSPCKVDSVKQLEFLQKYKNIRRSGKPIYSLKVAEIVSVPVSVIDISMEELQKTELKILDNISFIEHLVTETKKLGHSLQQTFDSKQKEFEQENEMHEIMLKDLNREKLEQEKLLKQLEVTDQEFTQMQKKYTDRLHLKEDKIKMLESKLASIVNIIS